MRPRLVPLVLAVTGLIAAAFLGCGGGDDTATEPAAVATEPLTKAELTDRADELCAGLIQDLESLGTPPNLDPQTLTPETIRASAAFWDQSADAGEDTVAELSGLTPPETLANRWDRFLKLYEQVMVDYQRTLADAAQSGDRSTFFKAAFRGQTALRDLNAASGSLGLEDCQTASAAG